MGKGSAERRAALNALGRARNQVSADRPKKTYERHVSGLDWLRARSKISVNQSTAGERYGLAWRVAAMEGVATIKSCLDIGVGGGQGFVAPPGADDVFAAQWVAEKRMELVRAQNVLLCHEGALAVLDLVCGRQLTPREALGEGASDRVVDDAVSALRLSLDLLHRHWWPPPVEVSR